VLNIQSNGAIAPVKIGQKGFGGVIYGKYKTGGDNGKSFYSDKEDDKSFSRYYSLDEWWRVHEQELPEEQRKILPFLYVPKASKSERNKGLSESGTGSNTYNKKCIICGKWQIKQELSDNYTCHCENPKWEEPKGNMHPTVKPIKLMNYLITLTSRENDVILDPFAGSGSTLIACEILNRNYIGVEKEEAYYNIAVERIRKLREQKN
jgi:site-specific DNA-methyltransferase (adenine-specific)